MRAGRRAQAAHLVGGAPLGAFDAERAPRDGDVVKIEASSLSFAHAKDVALKPDGFTEYLPRRWVARDQVAVHREEAQGVRRRLQKRCQSITKVETRNSARRQLCKEQM